MRVLLVVLGLVALFGYAVHEVVSAPPIRSVGLIITPPKPPPPAALAFAGPLPTDRVVLDLDKIPLQHRGCGGEPSMEEVPGGGLELKRVAAGDLVGKLGFQKGDVLWTLNDEPFVDGMQRRAYEDDPPGETATVRYERKGRLRVKLIELRN